MYAVFHLHVLSSAYARTRTEFGSTACDTLTQAREYICFGESSNLPTVMDDHSIGAQGQAKCGRAAK